MSAIPELRAIPAPLDTTSNPYLGAVAHLVNVDGDAGSIRGTSAWMSESLIRRSVARRDAVRKYAWAIPNEAALTAIATLGPIVEIGAGTGYWASLLRARGVDVVAYDKAPPSVDSSANGWHRNRATWTEVIAGDVGAVAAHPDRALFLCWPPYRTASAAFARRCPDGDMARDALRAYTGERVAYVGEGSGGCTGDDEFHDALDRDWDLTGVVAIPQWPGVHDRLFLYTRRGAQ